MVAQRSHVQRIFVRSVGFRFGDRLRRTHQLLLVVFFVVSFGFVVSLAGLRGPLVFLVQLIVVFFILFVLRDFRGSAVVSRFVCFGLFFLLLVVFFVFEDGAAGCGVRRNSLANQILLGFDYAVGEHCRFFVADLDVAN